LPFLVGFRSPDGDDKPISILHEVADIKRHELGPAEGATEAEQQQQQKDPITPAEARITWAAMERPSSRRVASVLSQGGRRVSHTTVAEWQRNGWTAERPVKRPTVRRTVKALNGSKGKANQVVPLVTGGPADTAADLPALEDITNTRNPDLVQKTCREGLDAARRIFFQIKNNPGLVAEKPAAVGSLLVAAGDLVGKAIDGLKSHAALQEADLKNVTPESEEAVSFRRPRETDPLRPALEAYERVLREGH
jgi:hypothetical protein